MAELAHIEPGRQVLEPSAGTGMLCEAIKTAQPAATVFAVEIDPRLCELLSRKLASPADTQAGICRNVLQADFLECDGLGSFDRIVMNPPFTNGDDIKHIIRAFGLLKPGGRIVALCANGPRQQDSLKPPVRQRGGLWEIDRVASSRSS